VTYRHDGLQLASGSEDKTVRLWDPVSGSEVSKLKGHDCSVYSVTYRHDGLQLASGSFDKTVRLWDPVSGSEVSQLKGHTGGVWSVTYRHDGLQLASAGADEMVLLWTKVFSPSFRARETWLLTHRFGRGIFLCADHAYLKDTTLSHINQTLLEQHGAKLEKD